MRQASIKLEDLQVLNTSDGHLVVPNSHYTQELQIQFNRAQEQQNKLVWERPDIVSYDQWLLDSYRRLGDSHPELASRSVISHSTLLLIAQQRQLDPELEMHAAALCEAWHLVWDWNLWPDWGDAQTTDNGQVCASWFQKIQRYLQRESLITAPEIPNLLIEAITRHDWKPAPSVWIVEDELTNTKKELIRVLKLEGLVEDIRTKRKPITGIAKQVHFTTPREELATIAMWAREKLSELGDSANIGIALEGENFTYDVIKRQFENTFPEVHDINTVVSINRGQPLSSTRLYRDFITLLNWTCGPVGYAELIDLAKSPYFPKLRLFPEIQDRFTERMTMSQYGRILEPPQGDTLKSIRLSIARKTRTPIPFSEAVEQLMEMVQRAGYSHRDIPLYSHVDQDHVDSFARLLDQVSSVSGMLPRTTWVDFVKLIELFAQEQSVHTGSTDAPIQVLSRSATRPLFFDALWVANMSDAEWPRSPNPNPFVPLAMQKQANLPRTTRDQMYEEAIEVTAWWRQCAKEVVFSFADEDDEMQANISQILVDEESGYSIPTEIEPENITRDHELTKHCHPWAITDPDLADVCERYLQENAKELSAKDVEHGRTSYISDRATCDFKAWAIHRAGLEAPPEVQRNFPDARERGSLFHYVTEELLKAGMDKNQVIEILDNEAAVVSAIRKAIKRLERGYRPKLPERFATQEVWRLKRSLKYLRDSEKKRDHFTIQAVEEQVEIEIGGLKFRGRIDRVDKTADLREAIIDYKTSKNYKVKVWDPAQFKDPQLPMYSLASPTIDGVGFYSVYRGGSSFEGTGGMAYKADAKAREFKTDFKGITSFEELKVIWFQLIEELVFRHLEGYAEVNPIDDNVCSYCHLQHHCRIFENRQRIPDDAEGGIDE